MACTFLLFIRSRAAFQTNESENQCSKELGFFPFETDAFNVLE